MQAASREHKEKQLTELSLQKALQPLQLHGREQLATVPCWALGDVDEAQLRPLHCVILLILGLPSCVGGRKGPVMNK